MKVLNIDELKAQIRPFLEEYLKEHGIKETNRKLKCPNYKVHKNEDETPAASFFPGDKEHFNCFVCSAAGDIFNAAFYLENKPLRGPEFVTENVLYLARKYKVSYELAEETQEEKDRKAIYKVVDLVVKYSNKYLLKKSSDKAKKYIEDRGWGNITEQFHLGYARSNELYRFLKKNGVDDDQIKQAGISIYKNNDGTVYIPIVEDRLIIPFRNYFGKISSIISRAILPTSNPKYLFTHNSQIHERSKELFNLNEAKKYSKDVYIVESNASVLTMYTNDVKNVVAISGKDMSVEQYNLLVRMSIEKIILCLDNDDAGVEATEKFIYNYKDKADFKIFVKELPRFEEKEDKSLKDPDDFINKYGIDKFINLPELSSFDWILNKFSIDDENERYKEILISIILAESNFLKREKMIKRFAEKTSFNQKTILQEIERFSSKVDIITSVKEVIEFKESLITDINVFEEKVWRRKEGLLGFDVGWPQFNKIFDGLQPGFYVIAGRTNIGKSAFMLSLAYQILKVNYKSAYVLYFSIDDSVGKCIARLIAMNSGISINLVQNPKFKIKHNDEVPEEKKEELLEKRLKSVDYLKSMCQSLSFKPYDNMEAISSTIKNYNIIAQSENKKLVVFVDKIHNVSSAKNYQKRELTDYVSVSLKTLSNAYEIPIIGSLEVVKSSIMERPNESHIKETQKLEDDSDATILLYNEQKIKTDTAFVFTENMTTYPIIEAMVPKNKLSDLSGYDVKIFYRFYNNLSYIEECSSDEQRYYKELL